MTAKIFINGIIGVDTTLESVISQFKSQKGATALEVYINSRGGFVNAGWGIYDFLNNVSIPVTTIAERAYSIASIIYMVGDIRKVEKGESVIMIHNPWGEATGDSRELRDAANYLEQLEAMFIDFYAQKLQLDHLTIKNLLLNETYLNSEQALDMGFANYRMDHEFMAMAFIGDNHKQKDDMNTKMENFYNTLKNFFNEGDVKNLIIQDATGVEIRFPDLELGMTPSKGDKALIDSNPAGSESRVMPDGSIYKFEGGKLAEILEAEVEVEARAEASEEQVQEETSEEVSEEVVEETTDEETSEESEVAEEVEEALEDTEQEPQAEQEEADAPENASEDAQVNEQIDIDALINQLEESIMGKLEAKYKVENDALKKELGDLKKSIGSDVQVQPSNNNRQTTSGGNFLTDALRGR